MNPDPVHPTLAYDRYLPLDGSSKIHVGAPVLCDQTTTGGMTHDGIIVVREHLPLQAQTPSRLLSNGLSVKGDRLGISLSTMRFPLGVAQPETLFGASDLHHIIDVMRAI